MRTKYRLLSAGFVLMCVSGIARAEDQVVVRFDPPLMTVQVGDPVVIDLVADLTTPVVGWGLDLLMDPVGPLGASLPPVIGASWIPAPAVDGDGLAGLAFPNSVSGLNVRLATLAFTARDLGVVNLSALFTSGDLTEGFALDPTGFATVRFESATITIIPEPSTFALGVLALGCVGLSRRRGACRARSRD